MLGNCLVIEELARADIAYFYTSSMNVHIASKGIEYDDRVTLAASEVRT